MLLSLLTTLTVALCLSVVLGYETLINPLLSNSFGQPGNATFDYVVIGGGLTGATVASQLATRYSVALIEAGGFYQIQNGLGSIIPALAPLQAVGTAPNLTLPLIDWGIVTTPQAGANGRRMHYARGKTLGGSSALNFQLYHRATVGSYQKWADLVGDSSYTFQNLLPYFKRSCHITPPNTSKRQANGSVKYDPTVFDNDLGGPVQISWPNWADPIASWVIKGMASVGMSVNPKNFNSGQLNGSAWVTSTINPSNSHRDTSQTNYLNRAMSGTNLTIYTQSTAHQILFAANKTATGVLVKQGNLSFTLSTRKEVILSAGTFQSPQLLMLSGIGSATILKSHGISVRVNLPGVGQNLQDQPLYGVSFRVNVLTASSIANNPFAAQAAFEQYQRNNSGPLTSLSAVVSWEKIPQAYRTNFTAATESDLAQYPKDWPEVEYVSSPAFIGDNSNYAIADPSDGYNYATVFAVLVAPLSRGNVTISSVNVDDLPVVNPAYLTNRADQEVAVASVKRIRAIWAAISNVTIGPEYYPGTKKVASDAEILSYIRSNLGPIWHASSTCSMGKQDDRMAVTDTQARVFGVQGLRVVDASILPFLPPGHPQSTLYALALKISDSILGQK